MTVIYTVLPHVCNIVFLTIRYRPTISRSWRPLADKSVNCYRWNWGKCSMQSLPLRSGRPRSRRCLICYTLNSRSTPSGLVCLLQPRYAPFRKLAMRVPPHAASSVYTVLVNAFITTTPYTAHKVVIIVPPYVISSVYTILHLHTFQAVLLLLKYEDVLQAALQVWETMGPPDLTHPT